MFCNLPKRHSPNHPQFILQAQLKLTAPRTVVSRCSCLSELYSSSSSHCSSLYGFGSSVLSCSPDAPGFVSKHHSYITDTHRVAPIPSVCLFLQPASSDRLIIEAGPVGFWTSRLYATLPFKYFLEVCGKSSFFLSLLIKAEISA